METTKDTAAINEEEAKEARRAYYRQWKRANPDKVKKYQNTYWTKRARALKTEALLNTSLGTELVAES